jgi:antibiotic biosynthesis monooxygenase (ABM) superfamily enzyme
MIIHKQTNIGKKDSIILMNMLFNSNTIITNDLNKGEILKIIYYLILINIFILILLITYFVLMLIQLLVLIHFLLN